MCWQLLKRLSNSLLTITSLSKVYGYPVPYSNNFAGLAYITKLPKGLLLVQRMLNCQNEVQQRYNNLVMIMTKTYTKRYKFRKWTFKIIKHVIIKYLYNVKTNFIILPKIQILIVQKLCYNVFIFCKLKLNSQLNVAKNTTFRTEWW